MGTGAAAVVELYLGVNARSCGASNDEYTKSWTRFWNKNPPTFQFCRYTIAITLTRKAKNGGGGGANGLVQSYAAIADARPAPCQQFIWLADSIARDALAETRFGLAEKM